MAYKLAFAHSVFRFSTCSHLSITSTAPLSPRQSPLVLFISSLGSSNPPPHCPMVLCCPPSTKETTSGCDVPPYDNDASFPPHSQSGYNSCCVYAQFAQCLFKLGVRQLAAVLGPCPLPFLKHTSVCNHTRTLWGSAQWNILIQGMTPRPYNSGPPNITNSIFIQLTFIFEQSLTHFLNVYL